MLPYDSGDDSGDAAYLRELAEFVQWAADVDGLREWLGVDEIVHDVVRPDLN